MLARQRPILYSRNKISTTLSGGLSTRVVGEREPILARSGRPVSLNVAAGDVVPLVPSSRRSANASPRGPRLRNTWAFRPVPAPTPDRSTGASIWQLRPRGRSNPRVLLRVRRFKANTYTKVGISENNIQLVPVTRYISDSPIILSLSLSFYLSFFIFLSPLLAPSALSLLYLPLVLWRTVKLWSAPKSPRETVNFRGREARSEVELGNLCTVIRGRGPSLFGEPVASTSTHVISRVREESVIQDVAGSSVRSGSIRIDDSHFTPPVLSIWILKVVHAQQWCHRVLLRRTVFAPRAMDERDSQEIRADIQIISRFLRTDGRSIDRGSVCVIVDIPYTQSSRMPNLDYYNTARMHQMVNSFQNILDYVISRLLVSLDVGIVNFKR